MSATVSSDLVWGVPVRPDLLGQALHAFQKVVPTLNALRLCQRFYKGENVHVTKLPNEIEQAIEDIIFETTLSTWPFLEPSFIEAFKHFECRCEPRYHVSDESGLREAAFDAIRPDMCEKCTQEGTCSTDCVRDCDLKVQEEMNDMVYGREGWPYDYCGQWKAKWSNMISSAKFAPYDKILKGHFGLEAYFATTRVNTTNEYAWPKHENHRWHYDEEILTTICYLTMAKTTPPTGYYHVDQFATGVSYVRIYGSSSYIIDLPALNGQEKRAERFRRALRVLKLKPYVHPSQLTDKVSVSYPMEKDAEENRATAVADKAKALAKAEWPQLIMLVKTTFEAD